MNAVDVQVRKLIAEGEIYGGAASPGLKRLEEQGRGSWRVVEVSLNGLYANGTFAPKEIPGTGYGVIFLAKSSHPGAMLELDINGKWSTFSPGDRLRFPFQSLTIRLGYASPIGAAAKAYLLVSTSPEAWPEESNLFANQVRLPVDLLGETYSSEHVGGAFQQPKTWVTIAEDTDPTLLAYGSAGTFEAHGFTRLRVLIDMLSNGANGLTCDLVPWYWAGGYAAGSWMEQGTERISVPDSDTSGRQYRVLTVPVAGRGLMYFAIRNLTAAARTGVGLVIQGIA